MSTELRFSMKEHRDEMNARGLSTWQSQAKTLAERLTQDRLSIELLTPTTYDCVNFDYDGRMEPQGEYGDYVEVEAFEALAERFLLALELIKTMEENQAIEDDAMTAQRENVQKERG